MWRRWIHGARDGARPSARVVPVRAPRGCDEHRRTTAERNDRGAITPSCRPPDQCLDLLRQRFDVDGPREHLVAEPCGAAVCRATRIVKEQDLDRVGARHITQAFDCVERVGRVGVAEHDRGSLRAHAAEQQAERNVDHQIATRAQARGQSLRFGGSVTHEDERFAGSAPAISAGRGFEHHARTVYARRSGSRYADPRPGSVFLSGAGGLEATSSAIRSPTKGQ